MVRRLFQSLSPAAISAIYGGLALYYVFLSDRMLLWFIHDPDKLTVAQTIKGWAFVVLTALLLYVLVRSSNAGIRRAMQAFVATNARFRTMVETTSEGVWVVDEEGKTIYANRALAAIFGVPYDIVTGANQSDFMDECWHSQALQDIPRHLAGETSRQEMCFRRPDGSEAWALVSSAPFVDRHGQLNGVLRMVSDITEQKVAAGRLAQALESQRILVNELDHRVRNTLTGILTLIDVTRLEATEIGDYSRRISGRIHAMSTAHSMLLRAIRGELPLQSFLASVFAGIGKRRIESDGPDYAVPYRSVVPMALALYELKDWSMHHGALGRPDGHVRLRWDVTDGNGHPSLQRIIWQEDLPGPDHMDGSFSLVQGLVRSDLGGAIDCRNELEGWRCEIRLPEQETSAGANSPQRLTAPV
jgi:PAS domain S-box-containing protein